jgi:hypothetical protein
MNIKQRAAFAAVAEKQIRDARKKTKGKSKKVVIKKKR